jgi:hypothetical protein
MGYNPPHPPTPRNPFMPTLSVKTWRPDQQMLVQLDAMLEKPAIPAPMQAIKEAPRAPGR